MQIVKITDCDVCYWVELDSGEYFMACKAPKTTARPFSFDDKLMVAFCEKILELEKENGTIKN